MSKENTEQIDNEVETILLRVFNDGFVYGELGVGKNDQESTSEALALIQPLIERRVSQALEDNTLEIQEQAKQEERDNIISYLESLAWIFNPEKELREFLGIISELKSGL